MKAQLCAKQMVQSAFILGMSSGTLCKLGGNKKKIENRKKKKKKKVGQEKVSLFFFNIAQNVSMLIR
jgi:hypothetical protein